MQRSYPLRWLALGIGLLATQCLDSISDDCTKTLTCDEDTPVLGPDCRWRYPDGREWTEGPQYDTATRLWRWPDGKETATQNIVCNLIDAGVDSGTGADCRLGTPCDLPRVCDQSSGECVECIDDSACSGNMPVGDAGAATVCDVVRHECVRCTSDENCSGDTPICKTDIANSSNNECVECTGDTNCGGDAPVCDETTNECTTSCSTQAECAGSDKPVCNITKGVCVECENDSTCTGTKTQCNIPDNECVECVDDSPCAATGEVCDTSINSCVQCTSDVQCQNGPNAGTLPFCDTEDRVCVTCLDDTQCTSAANSRCNPVSHVCTGCTDDSQCEGGQLCNQGTCVECEDASQCTTGGEPFCETVSGQCVECLDSSVCLEDDAAHCATEQGATTRFVCDGCLTNGDCAGKPGLGGLCRVADGLCVDCFGNAECSGDAELSRCGAGGTCEVCSFDTDCDLFEGQPNCKVGEGCVECVNNGDCTGNPDGAICKTVNTGAAEGPAPVDTCVECIGNTNCTAPGASLCSDNECVACSADADCAHIPGANVCDGGTCVQCTGPKRTACGTNVCDSLNKVCSTRVARSAALCDDCVSDDECSTTARCVEQPAGAATGYFCYPLQTADPCGTLGFAEISSAIPTIDSPSALLCLQRETTCPAFLNYQSGQDCDDEDDDDACGPEGSCEVAPGGFGCTISCISTADCSGGSCIGGLCEL